MSAATVLLDMERAQSMVADYVIKELYPTETPDFTVTIVATSGLTSQDDFRIFLTTDLPDGMLYTVVRLAGLPGWFLTAYKDVKKDEVE